MYTKDIGLVGTSYFCSFPVFFFLKQSVYKQVKTSTFVSRNDLTSQITQKKYKIKKAVHATKQSQRPVFHYFFQRGYPSTN